MELAVWDGGERVGPVEVIVSGQTMAAVTRDLGQPADARDRTLAAAALWAAYELEAHGVDRYGELTSEDPPVGELIADYRGVTQLVGIRDLPELSPGVVLHILDPEERAMAFLAPLDDLGKRVMALRLGFDRGEPRTPEEVAAEVGISWDEVRHIEKEAIDKLRRRRPWTT